MGNGVSDMCCRLRSAAQKGKKEECVQFLKEGAPVTCQDNLYKSTALHEACRYGHHEVACLLIKYHADVNALDCIGHTPLFSAAKGGYNSIVNLLIERGADVNIVSHKGKTALHSAMENGHKVVTLLLLEAGAKLDARDCEGRTPPQLAAQSGTLQALVTCKLVLENSQSSKTVDSIIDVGDPRIPARARVLLHAWQVAAKIGKAFPVPKTSAFEAESDEPLRAFFNSLKMSPVERKVAMQACAKRKRELGTDAAAGAVLNARGTQDEHERHGRCRRRLSQGDLDLATPSAEDSSRHHESDASSGLQSARRTECPLSNAHAEQGQGPAQPPSSVSASSSSSTSSASSTSTSIEQAPVVETERRRNFYETGDLVTPGMDDSPDRSIVTSSFGEESKIA